MPARPQLPPVQPHAAEVARLLIRRFSPIDTMAEKAYVDGLDAVHAAVELGIVDEESRQLLRAVISAARHTMRTNLFKPGRWALTLRLQPQFFAPVLPAPPSPTISNMPFGVFFCAGRHFNAYHVRFCDIARGGLRVVLPPTTDAYLAESRRHFNECFSLAWAQQLKNKDIPEGGSKAVCLVYPVAHIERERLLHNCVQKFTDGLLDLITPEASQLIRRSGDASELLYLGPDENITPDDINWIAKRAAERGYVMPAAFISSKPTAGINHKEYGVTSEGVAVFLREGLRAIGIDPDKQSWSVKLTGGPDGDVVRRSPPRLTPPLTSRSRTLSFLLPHSLPPAHPRNAAHPSRHHRVLCRRATCSRFSTGTMASAPASWGSPTASAAPRTPKACRGTSSSGSSTRRCPRWR